MSTYFKIFILILFVASDASAQITDKIDVKLMKADPDKTQHIIVVLNEQADISAVDHIHGKEAKTMFVYQTLMSVANQSQGELKTFLADKQIRFRDFYIVNMLSLKANLTLIKEIATLQSVKYVIEDSNFKVRNVEPDRTDKGLRGIEWNVSYINAPQVWSLGYTGQNVVIGGQDTGYEWNDACLQNKYRGWNGSSANHNYNWHDAIYANNSNNSGTNPCGYNLSVPCDDDNHGTHTMGTMVGDDGGANQIGIAPGAKWIGCRNMERGWGTLSSYVECFEWFLAPYPYGNTPSNGDPSKMPHVINNSWGCPTEEGCNTSNFATMELALNNLRNAGCVIVVSAGNAGPNCSTVNDPAAIFSGSFSVGATNNADAIANFSSRGQVTVDGSNRMKPNISAPGVNIRSCIKGTNSYASWNGTSMAGPHVAGLVALLISANPRLAGEVNAIQDIIEQSCIHLTSAQTCGGTSGSNIPNNTFGFGRIDALAAVNMALPSNFTPFVKQSDCIVVNNSNYGIILTGPNNIKYRVRVNNLGKFNITSSVSFSNGSINISSASLNFEVPSAQIIMKSPDNNYWSVSVENNGNLTISPVASLPANNSTLQNGDVQINNINKGIILRSPGNSCFMINISNLGKIMSIPVICQI
jgi:subtilisin family serine protease